MKRLLLPIVLILGVATVMWRGARPRPWAGSLPPIAPYRVPDQNEQPALVQAAELPPLDGFESPKPVVSADGQGNVVVVAYAVQEKLLAIDIVAWRSIDRGKTWEQPENITRMAAQGEVNFDPWLDTDGRGHYYIVHGLRSDGHPLIRRSKDAGKTWSDPLPIPWKHCDRPVLGVSPNGKQLVVAAAMSEPVANAPKTLDGNDPDLAAKVRASILHSSGVFLSGDHGNSWERMPDPFGHDQHAIPFSVVIDDRDRVAASWIIEGNGSWSAVSVSQDRGRTWSITTLVDSLQPDRPHPFNGERYPVLDIDGSNELHVAYVTSGATGLMVQRSRNWKSWENSVSLSNKAAEEVRLAAIDACGPMVHVMWMERIGKTWQAYYRGSSNHGVAWSAPCCLSESFVLLDSSVSNGFQIYGDDDQSSLRDDGLGRIHAVWCVKGGNVVHAIIEWSSRSSAAKQSPSLKPTAGPVSNGEASPPPHWCAASGASLSRNLNRFFRAPVVKGDASPYNLVPHVQCVNPLHPHRCPDRPAEPRADGCLCPDPSSEPSAAHKNAKSTRLGQMQLARGAVGLTVAKAGEARVMAEVCDDILMAYPAGDPAQCAELARLAQSKRIFVAVDSIEALDANAAAALSHGSTIGILVDLDVGHHRTGVQSPKDALELAQYASQAPA